ncbi:TRIC cation channel family protein [Aeromicrobium sp. UC242_57]
MTGLGGGVMRDVLIGAVPPKALDDWRYLVVRSPLRWWCFCSTPRSVVWSARSCCSTPWGSRCSA